jgi:hypothetical protein
LTRACLALLLTLGVVSVGSALTISQATAAPTLSPIAAGDIIASLANGQVNEYTPTGTFVQTLMTATLPTGGAFDAAGNLYVTEFGSNDILKLDAKTMTVSVFSNDTILGDGTSYNSPESIAFGPGFTKMYVSDANRNGPGGGIHVVNPTTGAGEGFYSLPTSSGSEGTGESDWLAFDHNGNLFMTNENPTQGIMQVDQTTGDIIQPSLVPNLPSTGYALSFDENGNVWIGDTSSILEYSPTGTLLNTISNTSFSTVFAATFDPLGKTFYAGDLGTGNIFTYDLTGTLLSSFNAGSGIDGLMVAGSTVAPKTPAAIPSPTTVPFGSEAVGTPTATQVVTLNSTGTADLVISSVPSLGGTNPGDFQTSANGCTAGLDLPPGKSCTISVAFDPTATGSRSATLDFSDNAMDSPQQVSLTGTGTTGTPTSLSTSLAGGGQSGTSISVPTGTAVTDAAVLTGTNASTAGGTVTYTVFSDNTCATSAGSGGTVTVTDGAVPASTVVTLASAGTYYWQASYSGDSGNQPSKSTCTSEVETVTSGPPPNTCTGSLAVPGVLAGTYKGDVTITGYCVVDGGRALITGDLTLAPGAALNATFALNDVAGSGTSSLLVRGDIKLGSGATLAMGCEPIHSPCTDDPNAGTGGTLRGSNAVDGSLIAKGALGVLVHASRIKGSVRQTSGGGGLSCAPPTTGIFSLFGSPVFSDYEDNNISGSLRVLGIQSCYFGALRNKVHQNLTYNNNTLGDPDGSEVTSNVVLQDIGCSRNIPAVQFGDATMGAPNKVAQHASGQCSFKTLQPNPAPSGPLTPISVKKK